MIFPCTTLTLKEADRLVREHGEDTAMRRYQSVPTFTLDDLRGFLDRNRFMWAASPSKNPRIGL